MTLPKRFDESDTGSGHSAVKIDTIAQVRKTIDLDRRVTLREIADVWGVSVGAVYNVFTVDLKMKQKLCAEDIEDPYLSSDNSHS